VPINVRDDFTSVFEMKNKVLFFLLCLLSGQTTLFAQSKVRKTVFILVDGIPADVVERVPTPHLDSLSKVGRYMRAYVGGIKGAYSESPTISAVGYNSLLTGTWANKHNVWDNAIKEPNYQYPTIFRLFKNQYPEKQIAIFSSWQDNRTKLAGEGLPETGNLRFDYHADGYELDTISFPQDKGRDFMLKIDNKVVDEAAAHISTYAPDLSWIYLEYTDDMGHVFGDSEKFYKAVQQMDTQIGKIAQAISKREKKHKEEWLIFITTDHGRDEQTGKSHGGQSLRQRTTWMVTSYRALNSYARYYTPAIVDIMPSIARFMNIAIPLQVGRELDGIPLIGALSLAEVSVNHFQDKLDITWKALEDKGEVKVWISTTNQFKTGGKDNYQLMARVPLMNGHATIDVASIPSALYKIVVEGPSNSIVKWYLAQNNKE
jgi:hypothetical protein